ncbi:unnamed protein product [Discosporangium mesarthrocarpum]
MGLSKVFFQQKAFNSIERLRTGMISSSIIKLQTYLRCWMVRKRFLKQRRAAIKVQAFYRAEHTRATVGREMAELIRKRREKEAQEVEEARKRAEEEAQKVEERALAVRLDELREEMQSQINNLKEELVKERRIVKSLQALPGSTVAIAGALSGFGPAIVRRLLQDGASVVAGDEGASEETAEAVGLLEGPAGQGQNGEAAGAFAAGKLVFVDTGFPGEEEGLEKLAEVAQETFGGMDGLVCNTTALATGTGGGAAASHRPSVGGELENLDPGAWAGALTGTLMTPMLAAKYALPRLRKSRGAGGAAVVMVGSTASLQAIPNMEAVAAAQGGLVGLTQAMAMSCGPMVRVNAVSVPQGGGRRVAPLGREGTGADAASAVSFLLSRRSGFVTGQNLVVDGGLSKKYN